MTTGPGPGGIKKWWIILAGAVALVLLVGGTVFGLSRLIPSAAPTPTPTPVASTTRTQTASPSTTAPVATTPTATPTPTPTPTPPGQSPYCKAFAKITSGGIAAGNKDGSIDFASLSDQFGQLISRYSAAAAVAPAELKADYAKVLAYLKQGKLAVDAKDLEELKVMVGNLESLNDTMTSIQSQSKTLCG